MAQKVRELPSRFAPPLVGDTIAFLRDPVGLLARRTRELGPVFRIHLHGDDLACFVGPEAFAFFLDERYFTRARANPPHVEALFGPEAVLFLEGDQFRERKELLMQVLGPGAHAAYTPTIERVMARYARRWADRGAFRWVPEITSMTMTIAAAIFLGADPDQDDAEIGSLLEAALGGILSVPVNLPFTRYGRALKARDAMHARIDAAIEAHVNGDGKDAMSRLIAARTSGGEGLTRSQVRVETFHSFAAHVAVIGGLSFLAMLLGQHGDVKERVRAEIRERLGAGPLTPDSLRALVYLDRVCREMRRVSPVVSITFFAKARNECTYEGVRIPKGIGAVGCITSTLRDATTYAEPARFDPDRWLGDRATARHHAGWVAHGGGTSLEAHRCGGEQLTTLMLKTFAVVTLRDYDWKFPAQDFSPIRGRLFATPRGALDVRFARKG